MHGHPERTKERQVAHVSVRAVGRLLDHHNLRLELGAVRVEPLYIVLVCVRPRAVVLVDDLLKVRVGVGLDDSREDLFAIQW